MKKVFVIVYKKSGDKISLLALKPNPEPNRNTDWYVVTGGVDKDEKYIDAAVREVREELGVKVWKIVDLDNEMTYTDHITGVKHTERCFGSEIKNDKIELNEEHIDYKWLTPQEFIETIWWEGNKAELKELVDKVLKSS